MDSALYETVWKAHENQAENWYWNLVPWQADFNFVQPW